MTVKWAGDKVVCTLLAEVGVGTRHSHCSVHALEETETFDYYLWNRLLFVGRSFEGGLAICMATSV